MKEQIENVHARRRANCRPAAVALWLMEAVETAEVRAFFVCLVGWAGWLVGWVVG